MPAEQRLNRRRSAFRQDVPERNDSRTAGTKMDHDVKGEQKARGEAYQMPPGGEVFLYFLMLVAFKLATRGPDNHDVQLHGRAAPVALEGPFHKDHGVLSIAAWS